MEVEVAHPKTGKPTQVRLSREVVADGIRISLYSSDTRAALAPGGGGRLEAARRGHGCGKADLDQILAAGLFFSVTCAEDIPFIDPAVVPGRTAGRFLGDYRVCRPAAACALWPRARIEQEQREAVRSDLPVLLINGERDPVTPPDFGRRAARFLARSLHVVDPYGSHDGTAPCAEAIADEFLRRGTVQGLDTSCLSQVKPKPFLAEPPAKGASPFS